MKDFVEFNGRKFYKMSNGYYMSSRTPIERLHIAIWKAAHGEIPEDYEIHHVDFNPSNNALENLQCLTRTEHRRFHMECRKANKQTFTCKYCGKEFEGIANIKNYFCSDNCRTMWRYYSGVDNEIRSCVVCGKNFMVNRYSTTCTCSENCRAKSRRKLTDEDVHWLLANYKQGDPEFGTAAMASKLGVSKSLIRKIILRKSYKDI